MSLYSIGKDPEYPADNNIKMTAENRQLPNRSTHPPSLSPVILKQFFLLGMNFITIRIAKHCIIGFQSEHHSFYNTGASLQL